jgi:hypothetical protein
MWGSSFLNNFSDAVTFILKSPSASTSLLAQTQLNPQFVLQVPQSYILPQSDHSLQCLSQPTKHRRKLASFAKPTDPRHDEPIVSSETEDTLFTKARAELKLSNLPRLSNLHVLSAVFLFVYWSSTFWARETRLSTFLSIKASVSLVIVYDGRKLATINWSLGHSAGQNPSSIPICPTPGRPPTWRSTRKSSVWPQSSTTLQVKSTRASKNL